MGKITAQALGAAVGSYIEQELVPKSAGPTRFALYVAILIAMNKTPQMIEQYRPVLRAMDVVNTDGTLELEPLYNQMKDAMRKSGTITMLGITFDEKDVDRLYGIAQSLAR